MRLERSNQIFTVTVQTGMVTAFAAITDVTLFLAVPVSILRLHMTRDTNYIFRTRLCQYAA